MDNSVVLKSQLVEAQVTGAVTVGRRYNFLDIPNLSRNNVVIYAIEALGYTNLKASPTGNPALGAAATTDVSDQVVFTLVDTNNNQFTYQFPVYSAVRSNNPTGSIVKIAPRPINLTACFIQLVDGTDVAVNESQVFNIYYYEKD
jgi:hypothetical protein